MKSLKLSLVAALAAGSLSALNATPLEQAIKNVDVSGFAWYRYDSGHWNGGSTAISTKSTIGNELQIHKFKAALNLKIGLAENVAVFSQFMYWADKNDGYTGTYNTRTNHDYNKILLRLAGLEYNAYGVKLTLGRQVLGTIWTDDMAGMSAKAVATVAPGMQIAAFAVDSFETADGDKADTGVYYGGVSSTSGEAVNTWFYNHNLYGAAFIGDFGGGLKAQIWGAYWHKIAGLAALKVNFDQPNFGAALSVLANFLGDNAKAINGAIQDKSPLDNGLFVNLKGKVNFSPVDGFVGVAYYGKKDALTINRLEDAGGDADMAIGRETMYQKNTWSVLSAGQNALAYLGAGFKVMPDLRLGVQAVYGQNTMDATFVTDLNALGSGTYSKKTTTFEGVVEANYNITPKLNVLAYYSHLNNTIEAATSGADDAKAIRNAIRVQVRYGF